MRLVREDPFRKISTMPNERSGRGLESTGAGSEAGLYDPTSIRKVMDEFAVGTGGGFHAKRPKTQAVKAGLHAREWMAMGWI
jgi:hypothetical protein